MELLRREDNKEYIAKEDHGISYEQILKEVRDSANPKIKVAVTDIDGVLRGKYSQR